MAPSYSRLGASGIPGAVHYNSTNIIAYKDKDGPLWAAIEDPEWVDTLGAGSPRIALQETTENDTLHVVYRGGRPESEDLWPIYTRKQIGETPGAWEADSYLPQKVAPYASRGTLFVEEGGTVHFIMDDDGIRPPLSNDDVFTVWHVAGMPPGPGLEFLPSSLSADEVLDTYTEQGPPRFAASFGGSESGGGQVVSKKAGSFLHVAWARLNQAVGGSNEQKWVIAFRSLNLTTGDWTPDLQQDPKVLSSEGGGLSSGLPGVALDGTTVHVFWASQGAGKLRFMHRFCDNPELSNSVWSPTMEVFPDMVLGARRPTMVADGGTVYALGSQSNLVGTPEAWFRTGAAFTSGISFQPNTQTDVTEGVYFLETDLVVPTTSTLQLGGGTVFSFVKEDDYSEGLGNDPNRAELIVEGALVVKPPGVGETAKPVIFSSAEAVPGEWAGIKFEQNASQTSSLSDAIVELASNGVSIDGHVVTLERCKLGNNAPFGILLEQDTTIPSAGSWDLEGPVAVGVVKNTGSDIALIIEGQLLARGTTEDPITFASAEASPTDGDWAGIRFVDAGDMSVSELEYCSFDQADIAVTVDSLSGDIFNCTFTNSVSADIYSDGDVVIQPGYQWDLIAPTRVVFESDASSVDSPLGEPGVCDLIVRGTLNTVRPPGALPTDWVVFESTPMDPVNGDDWAGITVTAGTDAQIEDADIGYAMRPVYFAYANTATLRNSLIHDFSVEGVLGWFSNVLIEGCTIERGNQLDDFIQTTGIRLHHSTGDVVGNRVEWQSDYGISFGASVSFCAGPGTGGDGPINISDNTIVGDNGAEERQSSAGIYGVGLCHDFVTVIESNTVETWSGMGLHLNQVADVDVACGRFEDNFINARFTTNYATGYGLLDEEGLPAEGPANFTQNSFRRSEEANFWIEAVEILTLDDNASGSVAGRNSFQLSTGLDAKFLKVKTGYMWAPVDAGQEAWFDEFGGAMTSPVAIRANCDLFGDPNLFLSPILPEDLCIAAKAQAQGPGSAALDDTAPALSALESKIPKKWRLGGAWPNPAGASPVRIGFDVPQGHTGPVSLIIYDVAGRRVAVLEEGALAPGTYTRSWRGAGGAGAAVPSGVYFARLEARGHRSTSKIVVTR